MKGFFTLVGGIFCAFAATLGLYKYLNSFNETLPVSQENRDYEILAIKTLGEKGEIFLSLKDIKTQEVLEEVRIGNRCDFMKGVAVGGQWRLITSVRKDQNDNLLDYIENPQSICKPGSGWNMSRQRIFKV